MKTHLPYLQNFVLVFAVLVALLTFGCSTPEAGRSSSGPSGFLLRTNYHGWADALWVSNGRVEAIIVPSIGRIMQFRQAGQDDGPFWENPALLGQGVDPSAKEWKNLGGDKAWPAPQSAWGDHAPTNWPPPVGFDATPMIAEIDGWVVTLKSSAPDPDYGVRVTRRIELDANEPTMRVTTSFAKVNEPTLDTLAVWIITQVKDPIAVYSRLPVQSRFPQQFNVMSGRRPPSVEIRDGILSLKRDPQNAYKIGLDTGHLLWVSDREVLRIDSAHIPYRTYTDDGASAEIYTNPDPLPYVELEMLSPASQVRVGDTITRQVTYTLTPRLETDPNLEARRRLK